MNLTKGQIALFAKKIKKRIEQNCEFQKALHGMKLEMKGLNVSNAIPIEEIMDGNKTSFKM